MSSEMEHFEESVTTCRFGQRCGEVRVNIFANTEIGLGDMMKELNFRIKMLEKQINNVEEQKNRALEDLKREKLESQRVNEIRKLTEKEVDICNNTIRNFVLLSEESAKLTYNPAGSGSKGLRNDNNEASSEAANRHSKNEVSLEAVNRHNNALEQSRNSLLPVLENLSRSPLVEVCMALSEIVQHRITDISKIQFGEVIRERTRKSVKMERDARLALEKALEDEKLRLEKENAQNQSLARNLGLDISDDMLRDLIKGSPFVKRTRFTGSNVRYVTLTPNLLNISWRKIGEMSSQKTIPLTDLSSVSLEDESSHSSSCSESCLLVLQVCDRPRHKDSKTLTLEFGCFETIEDNRAFAERWADAVQKCITRAKVMVDSSDGGGGGGGDEGGGGGGGGGSA